VRWQLNGLLEAKIGVSEPVLVHEVLTSESEIVILQVFWIDVDAILEIFLLFLFLHCIEFFNVNFLDFFFKYYPVFIRLENLCLLILLSVNLVLRNFIGRCPLLNVFDCHHVFGFLLLLIRGVNSRDNKEC
jgi:hypothetical protein